MAHLRKFARHPFWLMILLLLLAPGCGKWPPMVGSARDIESLPASEPWIRARFLPDADIPALARFERLASLDFGSGNAVDEAKITDKGLAELAKLKLPNLRTLNLGWCENITDSGLSHLKHLGSLSKLVLAECPQITGSGLSSLIELQALTHLDLRSNPNITDADIQRLASKSNWDRIHLGGCLLVTPRGIAELQEALPYTKIVREIRQPPKMP